MVSSASQFGRRGAYCCSSCGRVTRQTGRGDHENVELCAPCYDKGLEANAAADGDTFFEPSVGEVRSLLQEVLYVLRADDGLLSCLDPKYSGEPPVIDRVKTMIKRCGK